MKEGKRRREGILRGGRVHMEWLWRRSQGRGNGCGVLLCDDFPCICYIFLRIQTLDCESMFIESKMMENPRHESPPKIPNSIPYVTFNQHKNTFNASKPLKPSRSAAASRKKKKETPPFIHIERSKSRHHDPDLAGKSRGPSRKETEMELPTTTSLLLLLKSGCGLRLRLELCHRAVDAA